MREALIALVIEFTNDRRGARVVFGFTRDREDFSSAMALAEQAEVCILCMGDSPDTSGENFDRVSLDLPGRQREFIRAVAAACPRTVLVLQSGRPVSVNWEQAHIPAILEAWFPGEEGGMAVAETLLGLNSPSGRLPITFPRHVGQIPCHYTRRPGGGRRYVEMDWLPLYPFGYGLSYTEFSFQSLTLSRDTIRAGETIEACFDVTNTGKRKGYAVPQIYIRDMVSSTVKPLMALAAFGKVELESGETKRVSLTVSPQSMCTMGVDYQWRIEPGKFRLILASHAEHPIEEKEFSVQP